MAPRPGSSHPNRHRRRFSCATSVRADDPDLAAGLTNKILFVNTWHHLKNRVAYATKLATALAACSTSASAVVVVDFDLGSPFGPPAGMRLAPADVVEELRSAGFHPHIREENLPYQYVIVAYKEPPARCGIGMP